MTNNHDLARQIAREHAALRRGIADLHVEVQRLLAKEVTRRCAGKLNGMLSMFSHHLLRHFELEERGGPLEVCADMDPTARRETERLFIQHRQLENALEALRGDAERAEEQGEGCPDSLLERTEGFLDDLLKHEHAETDLVQALVNQEVGAGD